MHYLLFYEFVPDYLQRRSQYREEHLNLAWEAQAREEMVLAGAYADPYVRAWTTVVGDDAGTPTRPSAR